jgi:cephalosporin hydroxylase
MIHKLFLNNGGNICNKWIHYLDIYEKHFAKFVGKKFTMFEIGVSKGGSVEMWRDYFGKDVTIVGIDIDEKCKQYEGEQIHIKIGDQADCIFLQSLIDKFGIPDLVIDDGSHVMQDLITSFKFLYPLLKSGSVYLAEDLHTCYISEPYNGNNPNTFVNMVKNHIDQLSTGNLKIQTANNNELSEFWATTNSITCYDSIIVYEKRNQGRRFDLNTGSEKLFNHE